jgi:hypothetical protein
MNVLGWQKIFRRRKDNTPSPMGDVVSRVRFVRQKYAQATQLGAHTRHRASRLAAARKRIIYQPSVYARERGPEAAEPRIHRRWPALAVTIVVVALGLVATMLSGGLRGPSGAARRECVAALRAIEGSAGLWAIQNGKTTNDTPTDADLFGPTRYMPFKPRCPAGGSYIIGKVGDSPTCTIPEHRIKR